MKSRGRGRGYIPTPEEVRSLRGEMTQEKFAELVYTSAGRIVRQWESGDTRMHAAIYQLALVKVFFPNEWMKLLAKAEKRMK